MVTRLGVLFQSRPNHTPGGCCGDQAAFRWRLTSKYCGRQQRTKSISTSYPALARAAPTNSTLEGLHWNGCGIGDGCLRSYDSEAKRCLRSSTAFGVDD